MYQSLHYSGANIDLNCQQNIYLPCRQVQAFYRVSGPLGCQRKVVGISHDDWIGPLGHVTGTH